MQYLKCFGLFLRMFVTSEQLVILTRVLRVSLGRRAVILTGGALRATKNEAHDSSADLSKASESAWNLPWLVLRIECSLVFQDAL